MMALGELSLEIFGISWLQEVDLSELTNPVVTCRKLPPGPRPGVSCR